MTEPPPASEPGTPAVTPSSEADRDPQPNELSLGWKKVEVLGRPVAAFITALVVAAIGFIGQQIIADRQNQITTRNADTQTEITRRLATEQKEDTKRAAKQQDTRVYTELMSRREQADSELRRDMFTAILGEFLKPVDRAEGAAALKTRLLKLELLALNFGDSLSLSPLFLELEKEIVAVEDDPAFRSDPLYKLEVNDMRERLQGLARRVSGAQLAALTPVGAVFELDIPVSRVTDNVRYSWPEDEVAAERQFFAENFEDWAEDPDWAATRSAEIATRELRGIERSYKATFFEADDQSKSVLVELEILEGSRRDGVQAVMHPTEMGFELNFFNFPMIDNTRLSGDQRFALVMEKFGKDSIKIVGITFPGMYASLRDKPFMDDVIANLKRRDDSAEALPTEDGQQP